jgi:hypothetical protein
VGKMFPETMTRMREMRGEFQDELEQTVGLQS